MPPLDLVRRLRAAPFAPFRLVMSDGRTYDIRHRDQVIVTPGSAVVGQPSPEEVGLYESTDLIALSHVMRLEPLETPAHA
jgi:hypothetical protein